MQRFSSVTLHVSLKNPIWAEKLKITFAKIQILPKIFFPKWFGPKQIEAIHFGNWFHDKSAQTDCYKEMWIPILKRPKHLNLDLCALTMEKIIEDRYVYIVFFSSCLRFSCDIYTSNERKNFYIWMAKC